MKIIITENQLKKIMDEVGMYDINESVDYYDKIVNILEPPYFRNLETIGIPEDHYKLIFEKIFNQPISEVTFYSVINSSDLELYYEDSDGEWDKWEYDDNGNEIYYENSNGYWEKREFDGNGNQIYSINSNGYWVKQEYDDNGRKIYNEDSNGYWFKWEYDDNGYIVYSEDSNGYIIDKRNKSNINESIDYYDKIVNILEPPYFQNLETMGIPEDQYETIFSKIFNQPVSLDTQKVFDSNGNQVYYENIGYNYWRKTEYDNNGNRIYVEDSDGEWFKWEYDDKGKVIYYENSEGTWRKWEYDEYGDVVYFENSDGEIIDKRNNN